MLCDMMALNANFRRQRRSTYVRKAENRTIAEMPSSMLHWPGNADRLESIHICETRCPQFCEANYVQDDTNTF
jgi:hypothetical protein